MRSVLQRAASYSRLNPATLSASASGQFRTMTSATPPALDISPPVHRFESSTQQFDPSIFHRKIPVLAARISASQTTAVTKNDPIKGQVPVARGDS